ncbi:MAG: carbon monoxide dehydrogenase subunit G [Acidobacteria bacterium]|nr:carbon monoxide dehydrogenase subunit G [Acidobacteriota bacterium]
MELKGSYQFDALPERVFAVMTDPEVVSSCLPGCEKFEALGGGKYRVELSMGVAAITGRYEGTVELRDLQPPASYRLVVDGKGKPGFVKGTGDVALAADGTGTRVDVKGTAQVGGAIARVGQRLIGGVGKMMMDKFFAEIREKL